MSYAIPTAEFVRLIDYAVLKTTVTDADVLKGSRIRIGNELRVFFVPIHNLCLTLLES